MNNLKVRVFQKDLKNIFLLGSQTDEDSANFRAISADRKQKSFEMVNKIHMQYFSLITSEIPDLEQFKAWNLKRV